MIRAAMITQKKSGLYIRYIIEYIRVKDMSFLTNKKILFMIILISLSIDVFAFVYHEKKVKGEEISEEPASYPEVEELSRTTFSFSQLEEYFRLLAEKKGGEYAYKVLKIAPIVPGTDLHLLGHVVGEVLYKQKGIDAIKVCTDDFRNACSHTVVVGLLLDHGENVLSDIAKVCREAPGGRMAYSICYHGLGHGVLAFTGYDLPKAVELCKKTNPKTSGSEFPECVGGAIMEIDSGGGHDRQTWLKQSKKYLKAEDPLFPCMSNFMPKEAQKLCLIYLSPHLFKIAGNIRGTPSDIQIEKAFFYCEKLPDSNREGRDACFGGFGKEFVVLAKARDIRNISNMTDEELTQVYTWCSLATNEEGRRSCIRYALGSLYWGGTNGYEKPLRFCNIVDDQKDQGVCFSTVIGLVRTFREGVDTKTFCQKLPSSYRTQCEKSFDSG